MPPLGKGLLYSSTCTFLIRRTYIVTISKMAEATLSFISSSSSSSSSSMIIIKSYYLLLHFGYDIVTFLLLLVLLLLLETIVKINILYVCESFFIHSEKPIICYFVLCVKQYNFKSGLIKFQPSQQANTSTIRSFGMSI